MKSKIKIFYYNEHRIAAYENSLIQTKLFSNKKFNVTKSDLSPIHNTKPLLNSFDIFLFYLPGNKFKMFKDSLNKEFKTTLYYCIENNIPVGLVYAKNNGDVGVYSVDDEFGWIKGNTSKGNPLHGLKPKKEEVLLPLPEWTKAIPDMEKNAIITSVNVALLTLNL